MKKITIVGIGMGNPGTLTEEAKKIIESSRVLIGAPQMLEAFKDSGAVCVEAVAAEDIIRFVRQRKRKLYKPHVGMGVLRRGCGACRGGEKERYGSDIHPWHKLPSVHVRQTVSAVAPMHP